MKYRHPKRKERWLIFSELMEQRVAFDKLLNVFWIGEPVRFCLSLDHDPDKEMSVWLVRPTPLDTTRKGQSFAKLENAIKAIRVAMTEEVQRPHFC